MNDTHGQLSNSWIGVDLDGTLAYYDHWRGIEHIGDPIPAMVDRVKAWLASGVEVRIVTARVAPMDGVDLCRARQYIHEWCLRHLGQQLTVTHCKDQCMAELWDDRVVQVVTNTGLALRDVTTTCQVAQKLQAEVAEKCIDGMAATIKEQQEKIGRYVRERNEAGERNLRLHDSLVKIRELLKE